MYNVKGRKEEALAEERRNGWIWLQLSWIPILNMFAYAGVEGGSGT